MKIALCFLTYGDLSKPELWKPFADATDKYNIYIHNKYNFNSTFNKYCIKKVIPTRWGHISLVKASLLLFEEAYKNVENKYFILLSDSCIPLYTPKYIYEKIFSQKTNIISLVFFKADQLRIYNRLAYPNFFERQKFLKQSQWMCLTRETVKFFLVNDFTNIFGNYSEVPDEHYFINIINKYNIGYDNKKITFVNWKKPFNHPTVYTILTPSILEEMRSGGCLFARKISKDSVITKNIFDI